MKKILLTVLTGMLILSGCSNSSDKTKSDSDQKNSSAISSSETKVSENDSAKDSINKSEKSKDDSSSKSESKKKTKEEKVYSNADVDNAVKRNKPENLSVSSNYTFYWQDINKTYSNKELEKAFDRLQKICNDADFRLSFSFQNMKTNSTISYRDTDDYLTCSTIKAPFVKSLLENNINLQDKIARDSAMPGDDGTVASAPYNTVYTADQLIKYTIEESDNTAYSLLVKHYGYQNFNNLMYRLGANMYLGDTWIFTHASTSDMLKCFTDIYQFAKTNSSGKKLIEHMTHTDVTTQVTQALGSKYKVAHKYGSQFPEDEDGSAFNDCAIVYADSPFVLCIFTNQYPETEESCKVFRDLAKVFDDINNLIAN